MLVFATLGLARWWLTRDAGVLFEDVMEQEYGEKSRVQFRSAPEVDRRVAEVDRLAARVDADRALRHRVIWSGEREVFDDGREIRKIRNNVRSEPGKPAAYVYYYDRGYVFLIRVLWSASAQPGVDEERFYFDSNALPPLVRWVRRDGRLAESWDPYRDDGHGRAIRYAPGELMPDAFESRECDRAPTSMTCTRLGFKPR
ncbi:MAG TPA: hypothetical protein VFR81_01710 [Longimicrobium sp.]|nr:hypothetical protein [Longimicrobium sp.]